MCILFFVVGIVVGGIVGAWWVGRTRPVSVFNEDGAEAQGLRVEAKKVVHARIEKRKQRIVEMAQKEGRITNDGVEDMFCIGDGTAGNYLRQLVDEGRLVKVGTTGRGVYYTPTKEM